MLPVLLLLLPAALSKPAAVWELSNVTDALKLWAFDAAFNSEYVDWLLKTQILLIERVIYQGEGTLHRKYLRWLLFVAKFYGISNGNECVIQIPLTHQTVANLLHTTRESISRIATELVNDGTIVVNKKRITIRDIEAIESSLEN